MSTMREEIYDRLHPIFEQVVDAACNQIESIEEDCSSISENFDNEALEPIEVFNKFKADHPDQTIIVETSRGKVELRIGDAIIYEGMNREIVIDAE